MGAQLKNQPIPSYRLLDEHRHWAEEAVLRQPISAYESFVHINEGDPREKENIAITWPANLTSLYQQSFYDHFVLSRAWIVVPRSNLIALVDLIRNKTLRLALEISKQLGKSNNDLAHISKNDVDRIVTNNIFGGNVVITNTATDLTQIGSVTINRGDTASLSAILSRVGIDQAGIDRLLHAVEQDKSGLENTREIGTRTSKWITNVARGGIKLGAEVAKPILTSWLQQYLGL
jgi:AbiTii